MDNVLDMDSRTVSRRIKERVWPSLRENGFSRFTSRTAWRYAGRQVHVVNFQSFSTHLAGAMNITTYSFALNLGVYLLDVPAKHPREEPPTKYGEPVPQEFACHMRQSLAKSVDQRDLEIAARRKGAPTNWSQLFIVGENGVNLDAVVENSRQRLANEGLPWFDRFADLREVVRTLREDDESMEHTWGFGRPGSPSRNYMLGYVALALGDRELARTSLRAALDSGCFGSAQARMEADLGGLDECD